jgi:hypothetical protein
MRVLIALHVFVDSRFNDDFLFHPTSRLREGIIEIWDDSVC